MTRWTLLLALAVALICGVRADAWNYIATDQITVDNTSGGVSLTAAKINASGGHPAATMASCRVRTAEISFMFLPNYATLPSAVTATVGTLAEPGDVIPISGNDLLNLFRAIRTGSSSGQLDCTYTS